MSNNLLIEPWCNHENIIKRNSHNIVLLKPCPDESACITFLGVDTNQLASNKGLTLFSTMLVNNAYNFNAVV